MILFTLRKLGSGVIVLLTVAVLSFILLHLAPGGPTAALTGESGGSSHAFVESMRRAYGLNKPLYAQFGIYIWGLFHGNFGTSYYYGEPVLPLIMSRMGNTILLAVSAFILAVVIGVVVGIVAGYKPSHPLSITSATAATAGYSMPAFWLGLELIILFAGILQIFPAGGMHAAIPPTTLAGNIGDVATHLVLPAVSLSIVYLAQYTLTAQRGIIESMTSDYIRTARAKGMSEPAVLLKHAARNAMLPVVSLAGVQAARIISGATLVETVFNWPGVGLLAVHSVERRDMPVLLALFIISAVFVVAVNILTDLAYRMLDPRVRLGGAAAA